MSGRALFFRGERIQYPIFCITRSKSGRSQVTAVLRKTISQKKIPTRLGNGLIFKGLIGYFSMITHIQSRGVNP
jgi:hypothetical protein